MKVTFKDLCMRIGCSINYLNKQFKHCFTTDVIDKVYVNYNLAQHMFTHIRRTVFRMRRSRKLQSYSDTRFNGAFHTMNVFLWVFAELTRILKRSLTGDYLSIDKPYSIALWKAFSYAPASMKRLLIWWKANCWSDNHHQHWISV